MRNICVWKQESEHCAQSRIKKISSLFNRLRLIQSKITHRIPMKFTWESNCCCCCSQQHQQSHSLLPIFYEWRYCFFSSLPHSIKTESHCFLCLVSFFFLCCFGFGKFFSRKISAHHMKSTFSLQTGNMIEMRSNSWYFYIRNEMFFSLGSIKCHGKFCFISRYTHCTFGGKICSALSN